MPILTQTLNPFDDPESVKSQLDSSARKAKQQKRPISRGTITRTKPRQQKFVRNPGTGRSVQESIQATKNRDKPPQLNPGSRVEESNRQRTAPNNFNEYYDMMGQIDQIGKQRVAAAAAAAERARMQRLNKIRSYQPSTGSTGVGSQSQSSRQSQSGGRAYGSGVPSNPRENFKYAQQIAPQFGWDQNELDAWYQLGMNESGWRNTAQNPTSTAYGIGQFLDQTWNNYGPKTSDPQTQVKYMAQYINNRYGSPSQALAFWNRQSPHWY